MKKLIPILLLAGSAILSGCGDSNDYNQVSGQQGNPNPFTPTPPVAVNDVYATDEDDAITLTAAQGVLANDQVNDQAQYVSVDFPAATAQGGTITQTADTGAFTYTPALGFTGTDSFTYTLNNREGSDTATVTIEVDAAVVAQGYFVDSTNGNDTTADFDTGAPYATIQAAVLAAPVNSDIVVRPGNYTGSVTLKNGQRLLGSGSSLVNAQGAVRPILSGAVTLGDMNTLDFLRFEGTAGNAVDGDGQAGGIVTNCEFVDITQIGFGTGSAVTFEDASGRWIVSNNVMTNVAGLAIDVGVAGTNSLVVLVTDNQITNSGFSGVAFVTEGTSETKARVNANVFAQNGTNATVELIVTEFSQFGLDLEDNTNDDVYSLYRENTGASLQVEQLSALTQPKPGGAGNTGTVDIASGPTASSPSEVPNGTFDFN